MAIKTSDNNRNLSIYSIYLRNYGTNNNFEKLISDIPRIKSMNFDAIWLLPIHPIGEKNKKGDLGCPYSIKNFGHINPNYGTMDSFKKFIDQAHKEDLKVIIDVVYNHTSYDSDLYKNNPEYFIKDKNNNPFCKANDWSDVIDLDYNNKNLWPIMIDYLKTWSNLGVDGFRCDVASLVPIEFWNKARQEISIINSNTIWLAESVHKDFIEKLSTLGYKAYNDNEVYEAFDILYDYDIHPAYVNFIQGEITLSDYIWFVENQDVIYPKNYIKLRFIENHDQPRMSSYVATIEEKINFTVLSYMLKGSTLVYAGQETKDKFTPSLFEKDPVNFQDILPSYVTLLSKLNLIKKDEIFRSHDVTYEVIKDKLLIIKYDMDKIVAAINFADKPIEYNFSLLGSFRNILDETILKDIGILKIDRPIILKKYMVKE